jgi:hypothetical protein
MSKSAQLALWAVYQMTVQGQPGPKVVCPQHEWEAVEQASPGVHRLIKAGIDSEGEAERLARGTSGDAKVRARMKRIASAPGGESVADEAAIQKGRDGRELLQDGQAA